jgi:hypothetical protein
MGLNTGSANVLEPGPAAHSLRLSVTPWAAVLDLPLVERGLAHTVLPAEVGGLLASFMLAQHRKDL